MVRPRFQEGMNTMADPPGTFWMAMCTGFAMALKSAADCGIVKVCVWTVNDWSRSLGRKLCKARGSTSSHAARSAGSFREFERPRNRMGYVCAAWMRSDIPSSYGASNSSRFSHTTSLSVDSAFSGRYERDMDRRSSALVTTRMVLLLGVVNKLSAVLCSTDTFNAFETERNSVTASIATLRLGATTNAHESCVAF